jgi:hypothetical protein
MRSFSGHHRPEPGPRVAALGPLGQFRGRTVSAAELSGMASEAALDQLTQFRQVYEATLLPALASRRGGRRSAPHSSAQSS